MHVHTHASQHVRALVHTHIYTHVYAHVCADVHTHIVMAYIVYGLYSYGPI